MSSDNGFLTRPALPECGIELPCGPVMVVAPHADDEVCGVGGTIILHSERGDDVYVEVVTSGSTGDPDGRYGDIVNVRRKEALAAARILGVKEVSFWGLPDNFEITGKDIQAAASRLKSTIEKHGINTIYFPWSGECHNDHVGVSLAVQEALKDLQTRVTSLCYEVWTPLVPNVIVDISRVIDRKRDALSAYESQLFYTDYHHHILGLNAHRGIYLEGRDRFGEAFLRFGGI